jgi:CubicO group peptidase (beta-lactamase class C family)
MKLNALDRLPRFLWPLLLLLGSLPTTPFPVGGQSIVEVATAGLSSSRPGHTLGLVQDTNITFSEAFGAPGADSTEVLTTTHLFPFPAITELLVAAIFQAFVELGVLDPETPISRYFPLISNRLGTITLHQLMDHSGGLDDAEIPEGFTWPQVMDQLNDAALFTDPGAVHSRSRYSFPLAVRAIEKAAGRPFEELAEAAILQPLNMTNSTFDVEKARASGLVRGVEPVPGPEPGMREVPASTEFEGLPVLFTTGEDVLRFLAAWMGGGVRGTPPWSQASLTSSDPLPGDEKRRGGLLVGRWGGHLRAMRESSGMGLSQAIYLYPEGRTALVCLASGYPPTGTQKLALERVEAGLSPGVGITVEEAAESVTPTILQEVEGGWAGRYLNGDRKVELAREGEGLVYHTNVEILDLVPDFGGNMVATRRPTGQKTIYLKLVLDHAGKRYAIVDGKAFIHEKDARVYPHGVS